VGDIIESFQHFRLEFGLDGRERERILHIVVVEVTFPRRGLPALAFLAVGAHWRRLERSGSGGCSQRRRRLCENGSAGNRRRGGGGRPLPAAAPRRRWP